jgi:hypothetical protein
MESMMSRFRDARFVARIFWILAVLSIAIWSQIPSYSVGWDVDVYKSAIASVGAGHNPYEDAMAVQRAYQSNPRAYQPGVAIPYSYVYSPITLPVIRFIARLPQRIFWGIYWAVYFFFATLVIWVGLQFTENKERPIFLLLSSVAIFFPGMLENDVLFSGNVAYILYGLVFFAALIGWKKQRWTWFYAAVLLSGCCKAPMLTLLAIPVLSARRQWLPAGLTAVAGIAMFAIQPKLWPVLFHSYMQAVELQFSYNRDFSSSPAGLIANALYGVYPYQMSTLISYLAYALIIGAVLFYLSKKFLAGYFSLTQWVPVLLVGTILLNPRVMEYDIAPITLPIVLVVWRVLGRGRTLVITSVMMGLYFAIINTLAAQNHVGLSNPPWKLTAGITMVAVFAFGSWDLWQKAQDAERFLTPEAQLNSVGAADAKVSATS